MRQLWKGVEWGVLQHTYKTPFAILERILHSEIFVECYSLTSHGEQGRKSFSEAHMQSK